MKRLIYMFASLLLLLGFMTPLKAHAAPVNINSIVYGPPPATAPTIDAPVTGESVTSDTVTVNGTCTTGLDVRVFKNTIFAGSTICAAGGTYTMQISLFVGSNSLIARQYDGLNQPSPDSNIATVTYTPIPVPAPVTPPGQAPAAPTSQFVLGCDYSTNRAYVDKGFSLPCQVDGGFASYAISVDWGDGTTSVVVRNSKGNFVLDHVYKKSGNYIVQITGSDSQNQSAFMQMAIVVTGRTGILEQLTAPLYQCKPDIFLPLLLILLLMLMILLTSYQIGKRKGEREELEELRKLHRLKNPEQKKL